ncbi:hypothetical protein, partial [Cypionkella sp.]|uniref:hypothetical protein n=1 Tax=Cypionkella sp. TaxID=2811411 RepID=UPI002724DFC2
AADHPVPEGVGDASWQNRNCRVSAKIIQTLQAMARKTTMFQRKINGGGVFSVNSMTCCRGGGTDSGQTGHLPLIFYPYVRLMLPVAFI